MLKFTTKGIDERTENTYKKGSILKIHILSSTRLPDVQPISKNTLF